MSGHSKWSSIKHKKGAADAKRGKLFSKLSRAIIVAAKEGGPDPAGNLALQNAIEKARSYSMPKDNIDRAIARGSGADADSFEQVVYEGYGPSGVAVIVEALTDNRNRTASEVRHIFAKFGGNLGTTGAVAWQFERRGVVRAGRCDPQAGRAGRRREPTDHVRRADARRRRLRATPRRAGRPGVRGRRPPRARRRPDAAGRPLPGRRARVRRARLPARSRRAVRRRGASRIELVKVREETNVRA